MKRGICVLCTLTLVLACTTGLAEINEAYGYTKGQQENAARHAVYAQLENHDTTVDKSGYVDAHAQAAEDVSLTLSDAEALLEAGVIDQATLDQITVYAAVKHANVSSIYADISGMTPAERNAAFAVRKTSDGETGDSIAELVEAGVITQEQADDINAWLAK